MPNRDGLLLPVLVLAVCCMNQPARASETDALAISANIQAKHLPFGTILDPIYASPTGDEVAGYTRCGDSAIWTGHYLAAESFRYAVTRSADALANVRGAVSGLKSLADVTGTNLLARCLIPLNSPYAAGIESEEKSNGVYINSSAGYAWIGNTSRDQFVGVFFGLAVAYDLVDDAPTQTAIRELVTRLDGFLSGHNWNITMPDGRVTTTFTLRPDELLMVMDVAAHINPATLTASDRALRPALLAALALPVTVDTFSDSSYFKFNLAYATFYNLIRLQAGNPPSAYSQAYSILRAYTASHQNAFFNMVDRSINGPGAARDMETLALLDEWLLRPRRDNYVDDSASVKVCGTQACAPVPVPLRPPTDFLWQRSPFQLAGGGSGKIENSGIDYILPYWMSRYYGLNVSMVAQSAAAPSPAVAPDSLGSLYGVSLASHVELADTLPLPVRLGGVSLTVKDSTGQTYAAPLSYVSPEQVNFLAPAGLAAGAVTFTLSNQSVTTSSSGVVWPVVPRLFSVAASGLAAASTVRVDGPGQAAVEVSRCDASGCIPQGIDVNDGDVVLELYGTGIRNRTSLADVVVTAAGISLPVLYAGPQPQFPGLDQVNVRLPANLAGAGLVDIVVAVSGQTSNAVSIDIL